MTRKGYKDNQPFLGMLPAFSVGTKRVSVNMTYIPKVDPKAVPLWFFQLKISLGKYAITEPLEVFMEREMTANRFRLLPLEIKHISLVATLPFHHRDPFDRLLVAQAIAEQIPIISGDKTLDAYAVQRLW